MAFTNVPDFRHDAPESLGVLVLNLGTPEAPTARAVRRYLGEFLWDPRVVEIPRPIWWLILHGLILRVRPARSARAYRAIWTERGSPLLEIARRQAEGLQGRLSALLPGPVRVVLGMRYGSPSIPQALSELKAAQVRRLLVLPLYPQYSATTTASTFDAVTLELSRWRWIPELRFINQYHDEPAYIAALVASIREHWADRGEPRRLLFSFHGIPKDYFLKGDPYHCQCHKTARLVCESLDLSPERWALAFQSRVGTKEWLRPYTDETLKSWGGQALSSVQVISPGFSADCLETLEEIGVENRALFQAAGGGDYGYIPCLNDRPDHLSMLADLVRRHSAGWPEALGNASIASERAARAERAQSMGAPA